MTTKTDEQERKAFEAWLRSKWTGGYGCAKYDDGSYVDPIAQLLWESRQDGRAALQSQDAEDALRYRWLIEQAWFQEAFDRFDPDDGGYLHRFVSECARIIDHARRIEDKP